MRYSTETITLLCVALSRISLLKNATWKLLLVNMSERRLWAGKKKYIFRTFANVMNPQVNWEFTIVELWLYKNIIYEGTKQVFKKIRDATTNIQGLKKEVHYYSSKFFSFLWSIRVASSLTLFEKYSKCRIWILTFSTNFCLIKNWPVW